MNFNSFFLKKDLQRATSFSFGKKNNFKKTIQTREKLTQINKNNYTNVRLNLVISTRTLGLGCQLECCLYPPNLAQIILCSKTFQGSILTDSISFFNLPNQVPSRLFFDSIATTVSILSNTTEKIYFLTTVTNSRFLQYSTYIVKVTTVLCIFCSSNITLLLRSKHNG